MVTKRLKKLFPRRRSADKTASGEQDGGSLPNSTSADDRRRSSASGTSAGARELLAAAAAESSGGQSPSQTSGAGAGTGASVGTNGGGIGGGGSRGSGGASSVEGSGSAAERRPTNKTSLNESESTASGIGGQGGPDEEAPTTTTVATTTSTSTSTSTSAGDNKPNATKDRSPTEGTIRTSNATETAPEKADATSPPSAASAKMTNGSSKAVPKEEAPAPSSAPKPKPAPLASSTKIKTSGYAPLSKSLSGSTLSRKIGGQNRDAIFDDPVVVESYDSVPLLEITNLPRGGISMETQAVGRVQFGIPPETIKDSMVLGLGVPSVYIVPVERFCREMGPALGVNLAEFEFPAYFNFFVQRKRCTLIVDSDDAEKNICRVFSETLLGPAQFRRGKNPIAYEPEDFADTYPREAIPDFQKEFKHFRIMPDGKELVLETLLKFNHFRIAENGAHEGLGVPPILVDEPDLEERLLSSAVQIGSIPEDADADEETTAAVVLAAALQRQRSDGALVEDNMRSSYIKSQQAAAEDSAPAAESSGSDLRKVALKLEKEEKRKTWSYSQAKWIGDVATIYPEDATPEQIEAGTTKRVEVFKMPGGGEYILHDVDENNKIVGKVRFSGHVKVSEAMSVDGFGGRSFMDSLATASRRKSDALSDSEDEEFDEMQVEKTFGKGLTSSVPRPILPPTFHPPSFGVTVLGNSHGFDKSGSVSGYVLWVNGRGVMIDPPPYSSATLEREGIRPRMIVGIIITHCHADHDAGTFQKVLTGSQVVVITTPTIYKSFIRKYSALSALSPALLRHSHRYKPAIIGAPLRFQGATFHFTYSLHTIPCVGFRVEWRGRSMVFTADHFNSPEGIQKMADAGTLSKGRAEDLKNLPLQDTDCLLHEAGAPPIHTPLDVLMKLPPKVKKHMYVVHTSNLPEDCGLRVAPTGTAGTIRLDQVGSDKGVKGSKAMMKRSSILQHMPQLSEDTLLSSGVGEYDSMLFEDSSDSGSMRGPGNMSRMSSIMNLNMNRSPEPPLVSLRPTSSTDAWFILNLLSAVPFLSSLSYASTMEVLETARVDAFCQNDIVVPANKRHDTLVVVWEGTCMERETTFQKKGSANLLKSSTDRRVSTYHPQGQHRPLSTSEIQGVQGKKRSGAVWFAGDWTGPRALQPEKRLSGESSTSKSHDIVAMSSEGVKVITVEFSNLHAILQDGSSLYRKYLSRRNKLNVAVESITQGNKTFDNAVKNLNIIELLECNSALRKLSAVQKRHLESLAEGPAYYNGGQRLWRQGSAVDKAFIIVGGTASFIQKRRMAGSASVTSGRDALAAATGNSSKGSLVEEGKTELGNAMRVDALKAIQQLGGKFNNKDAGDDSDGSSISSTDSCPKDEETDKVEAVLTQTRRQESFNDLTKLSRGLQKRADSMTNYSGNGKAPNEFDESDSDSDSGDSGGEDSDEDVDGMDEEEAPDTRRSSVRSGDESRASKQMRRRSSRDRFANKVLGRLYESRAFTSGLVFSRGHFLGDVSKMVAGLLAKKDTTVDDSSAQYGFGGEGSSHDGLASASVPTMVVNGLEEERVYHSSTLAAGKDGCVVLVFPKSSLIPFMDEHPGLLLSLLGTQVVV